jgi:antitoxin (DNA-binding transcriptional repressor) of toxin-antitoxin stability system
MVSRIPISKVTASLGDLVDRVRAGEEFVVEQSGEDVLRIGPVGPRQMTWGEMVDLLKRLPPPDEEFFEEVERVTKNQGEAPANKWE